jgi:hypothetical protein
LLLGAAMSTLMTGVGAVALPVEPATSTSAGLRIAPTHPASKPQAIVIDVPGFTASAPQTTFAPVLTPEPVVAAPPPDVDPLVERSAAVVVAPSADVSPAPPPPPASASDGLSELALLDQLLAALDDVIPAAWLAYRPGSVTAGGAVPRVQDNGAMLVPVADIVGDPNHLVVVVAHEWGHVLSISFGAGGFGAPPAGFPTTSSQPAEEWADCISVVLTGIDDPSHGLPPCPAEARRWTDDWLEAGPQPG